MFDIDMTEKWAMSGMAYKNTKILVLKTIKSRRLAEFTDSCDS